ncbi:uncharacterized protein FA14DRAFT_128472 [Meira miltonrushii]|uniref:uS12 prolyl 3,4-dihydroxylase n=1 Tax=Meira miltonrushii TaxID=1280837 RepID=A0A316V140_9BASI|nr:uncharacterized protein FA14DRAFT_128472 [Meira miltonrushii]PWN31266.1 hypothetical protein FA14DRAFT_128472 [Meira miltonrushii]
MSSNSEIQASFSLDLFTAEKRDEFAQSYTTSQPYRHSVIDGLIDDSLLRRARKEIIDELRFTEKETDIYKVNQTGDLANLDGLPIEEAKRLENVLRVRNAIYSDEFRSWLEHVTGCGPLSAKKKDMSINDYTNGCHLLNHDDVISTRRVSYILYLPDPTEEWNKNWGGALELYPVKDKHIPANSPSVIIPPKWNQFTFFAVQPGHSFHAVEEVVHPSKSRLSISGWFHRPQPEEKGFDAEDEKIEEQARKDHASAEGLLSKEFDLPFASYNENGAPLPGSDLSLDDKRFLAKFINPAYLQSRTQNILFERFGEESHILLIDFLRKEYATALENGLRTIDGGQEEGKSDNVRWWELEGRSKLQPPSHQLGVNLAKGWSISGPPHRQRFLNFNSDGKSTVPLEENPKVDDQETEDGNALLSHLQKSLFPSPAFRHLLANISQLVPIGIRPVQVRRFRPGLDYTLARSDAEAVLDVTLDLTPNAASAAMRKAAGTNGTIPKGLAGKRKASTQDTKISGNSEKINKSIAKKLKEAWETGELGGWEAYMPPTDESDDPAVYGSGKGEAANDAESKEEEGQEEEMEIELENEEDEADSEGEDDGVLLNLLPQFNTLSLVLRDEGVMRFVKYLSASAGGSRFDVSAEYEVGAAIPEES